MMTKINITLNSPWFELVRDGKKKYEGRRKHPKYMCLQKGDLLAVSHHTDKSLESYDVCVESVLEFPTFKHALEVLPLEEVLPIDDITVEKGVNVYYKYVSQATQEKEGIVMIKLCVRC
jgi:ASC-1-like (ASCH) protein